MCSQRAGEEGAKTLLLLLGLLQQLAMDVRKSCAPGQVYGQGFMVRTCAARGWMLGGTPGEMSGRGMEVTHLIWDVIRVALSAWWVPASPQADGTLCIQGPTGGMCVGGW